jgi:oligopeptide transport system substrate-binding protein
MKRQEKILRRFLSNGFSAVVSISLLFAFVSCTSKSKDPANTLHIASVVKIKGLDPIMSDDLYSSQEVARTYDGLLQYSYLKRPYTLEPNLAESLPQMSADGKTLTIKLSKGTLFQDDPCFKESNGKGREFTADDVVYSYKRLADPKLTASGWWIFDGKIVGLNEWHDAMTNAATSDYTKVVDGLQALDRYTVQIKLKQRSYQFQYFLAMPFTFIVPHEAVEYYGKDFVNHPVGTGPYKLTEFNPSSRLIWDRNPTFRKQLYPSEGEAGDKEKGLLADAGKPLPLSDRVTVQIIEEDQPRWLSFLSGKLDYIDIPKDNYAQAVGKDKELLPELKQKNYVLNKSSSLDVTHVSFNMADPVVGKNKLLRQALSLAYDSNVVIDLFYNGRAIPAQGPIPPGLAGYDANFKNPYRQFSVEKAKELLAKAGFPGGKGLAPLDVVAQATTTDRQMTEYMEKAFAAIGVKCNISQNSWPQFQDAIKNKKGQLWAFAWLGDYPDAEDFLQLFYGKNVSPGSNDANYVNPEFDKLYEKSLTMPDSPARTDVYKQMVKIVTEDTPWIFGAHRMTFTLLQPWTKNYKYNDVDAGYFKYIAIDTALRK